ncbi:ABC transporter ATP-binding protein/permease [Clostridium senegalense]|uniref:ABC transporter ATP-binding protein n=1 Tax=Clostridium senegalense TaxID=1465809 RepID=UPI001C109125|nr:ABC transporter ATP-binding protein [Clostridium senegalense]MBU5225611.1 ABC transporter ATP-binding protein/permease [Clostridium senegalense]
MKKILNNIWEVAKEYKWQELIGLIFTILYTIAVFISPIVSRYLIDEVIPSNSLDKLKIGILIFFGGCICQPIFGYLKNRVFMKISENITIMFREEMFNKVINAPMEFFDGCNNGAIVSRISNDGRNVSEFITNFFVVVVKNIVLIIMIIIGMLILSKEITLMVILLYAIYFFVNWKISHKFNPMSKDIQESYDQICIKINRSVGLVNTIKAFNQEDKVKEEFKEIIERNYRNNLKFRKLSMLMNSVSNGIMITSLSIVYGIGSLLVMDGKITIGTVVAIGLYFQLLVQPIYELLNSNIDIHTIIPIFNRINEYMNLKTERASKQENEILYIKEIELKNVNFKYNNGSEAVKNINLKLPSKGIFAIVGDSGAGKSSLIKLLSAFYDSYEGEIKINEKELKEYGVRDVRSVISLVSQDIELLNESIKNNIKMGRDIEDLKIEEVIRNLNLEESIKKLELGYDTVINERVNLSGGEKQRLSIARALVKKSLIYIFDEPTAALDTINEKRVKDILEELSKQSLVIIITHNLSLLNKADCIYTMKKGEIVEEGNYEYLTKKDSYFSKLMKELSNK